MTPRFRSWLRVQSGGAGGGQMVLSSWHAEDGLLHEEVPLSHTPFVQVA